MLLARWYEWVFGPILMTCIGVILSLQSLSGFNRWLMIIGLMLYLIASLARVIDDARKRRQSHLLLESSR
ncbi:hypothetical protein ES703_85370 [subsurface metagenome]